MRRRLVKTRKITTKAGLSWQPVSFIQDLTLSIFSGEDHPSIPVSQFTVGVGGGCKPSFAARSAASLR
jgi:hypothetical protein